MNECKICDKPILWAIEKYIELPPPRGYVHAWCKEWNNETEAVPRK